MARMETTVLHRYSSAVALSKTKIDDTDTKQVSNVSLWRPQHYLPCKALGVPLIRKSNFTISLYNSRLVLYRGREAGPFLYMFSLLYLCYNYCFIACNEALRPTSIQHPLLPLQSSSGRSLSLVAFLTPSSQLFLSNLILLLQIQCPSYELTIIRPTYMFHARCFLFYSAITILFWIHVLLFHAVINFFGVAGLFSRPGVEYAITETSWLGRWMTCRFVSLQPNGLDYSISREHQRALADPLYPTNTVYTVYCSQLSCYTCCLYPCCCIVLLSLLLTTNRMNYVCLFHYSVMFC